jgi:hypothetical protein
LVRDGRVRGRSEAKAEDGEVDPAVEAVLRELLIQGDVIEPAPDLIEQPWFWVATVAALGIGAAVAVALTAEPEVRTSVVLP